MSSEAGDAGLRRRRHLDLPSLPRFAFVKHTKEDRAPLAGLDVSYDGGGDDETRDDHRDQPKPLRSRRPAPSTPLPSAAEMPHHGWSNRGG